MNLEAGKTAKQKHKPNSFKPQNYNIKVSLITILHILIPLATSTLPWQSLEGFKETNWA